MPYFRQRSLVFAPASASFSTAMICSSLKRFAFIVRSHCADSTLSPYYSRGSPQSLSPAVPLPQVKTFATRVSPRGEPSRSPPSGQVAARLIRIGRQVRDTPVLVWHEPPSGARSILFSRWIVHRAELARVTWLTAPGPRRVSHCVLWKRTLSRTPLIPPRVAFGAATMAFVSAPGRGAVPPRYWKSDVAHAARSVT